MYSVGTYAVGQVLGRKDTTEALLLVNYKHAVRALGRTQLTGLRDGDGLGDCERRRRLECCDGALGYAGLRAPATSRVLLRG